MNSEPVPQPKGLHLLIAFLCSAIALSACAPTHQQKTMTSSSNPSDNAAVKAQVEQLKQALVDLHVFKTETQKVIGPQKWKDEGLRNMSCSTSDGKDGVNYSVLSQTMEPLDLEASVKLFKAFWDSKGFTTQTEPRDPGLIDVNGAGKDGYRISFTANVKGSSLEMDTVCIAGNQHEIYAELDRQEASSSPAP